MVNSQDRYSARDDGFSLVELLVVIGIAAILMAMAVPPLSSWVKRYGVEKEIKEMQMDVMKARVRAMQRNRVHFLVRTASSYALYEDTNPLPDGNGTREASDSKFIERTLHFPITSTSSVTEIEINTRGLVPLADTQTIRAAAATGAEYDCVIIAETRTNIGSWDGSNCIAK